MKKVIFGIVVFATVIAGLTTWYGRSKSEKQLIIPEVKVAVTGYHEVADWSYEDDLTGHEVAESIGDELTDSIGEEVFCLWMVYDEEYGRYAIYYATDDPYVGYVEHIYGDDVIPESQWLSFYIFHIRN